MMMYCCLVREKDDVRHINKEMVIINAVCKSGHVNVVGTSDFKCSEHAADNGTRTHLLHAATATHRVKTAKKRKRANNFSGYVQKKEQKYVQIYNYFGNTHTEKTGTDIKSIHAFEEYMIFW